MRRRRQQQSSRPRQRRRLGTLGSARRYQARNRRTAGFLGIEKKFLDCAIEGFAIPSTADATTGRVTITSGCTNCLSASAKGDGEQEREGRKITMKSIYISGIVRVATQSTQSAGDIAAHVIISLVWDKQTNGAAFNSQDVYTNPSSTSGLAANPLRNLE